MKKFFSLVCILAISMSFASCAKPGYISDENGELETESQSEFSILKEDVNDEFSYLKEGSYGYATNNKGFFYVEIPSNQIMYFDYSSGETEVWCTNLTCKHKSKECSAYVDKDFPYVEWYDGYVYKIDSDDQGQYLVQYKEDGTGETRIANLLKDYPTGAKIDIGRTYKGMLYYFVKKENNTIDVNRVGLSSKDNIENLFNFDVKDTKVSVSGMYINDGCIYISMAKYEAGDNKKFTRVIYRYDFISKEFRALEGLGNISRSCANDNLYYLTDENRLYKVDNKGITTEIATNLKDVLKYNDYSIFCNSNYIVFSRETAAAFKNENVDIYIYNIKNDTISCVSDVGNAGDVNDEKKDEESSSVQVQGGSQVFFDSKRGFWGVIGLSAENAFISGKKLKTVYVISLEDGSVTELPIEVNIK